MLLMVKITKAQIYIAWWRTCFANGTVFWTMAKYYWFIGMCSWNPSCLFGKAFKPALLG